MKAETQVEARKLSDLKSVLKDMGPLKKGESPVVTKQRKAMLLRLAELESSMSQIRSRIAEEMRKAMKK